MIHIVFSFAERYALSIIGDSLRKADYDVSDVWADCQDLPTDGENDVVDTAWYAGQVIQKLADMLAAPGLINNGDVIIYDTSVDFMPAVMQYLFHGRSVHRVEFIDTELIYQGEVYQPIDLMEKIYNA